MKELTKEELERLVQHTFKNEFPIKHYIGKWKDGTPYSMWDFSTPGMKLFAGDGAILQLQRLFEEELSKFINPDKNL